jgi:hypothetical protein
VSHTPTPPRGDAARRVRRWLLRAGLAAAAAVAVLVAAAAVLLHRLDAPWLERRIAAAVRSGTGLEIEYRAVRLRLLSGVIVEGLVVRTPPALRDVEPTLARVGRVEVTWSPAALLGRQPRLERVSLDDVAVALVTDDHGRSSLDLALHPAGPPAPSAPAVGLSRVAGELLSKAPPLGGLDVTSLSLTVVRVAGGRVADRLVVRGLSLHGGVAPAGGAFRLRVDAGSPSAPLVLDVARDGDQARPADARLEAALAAELSPVGATASLDVRVRAQTFAAGIAVRELLHAEAKAAFDAAHGRTEVSVSPLRAADGLASLDGQVVIDDAPGSPPLVRSAHGDVDVAGLLRLLPAGVVPATVKRGEAHWRAEGVVLGAPLLAGAGTLAVDAAFDDVLVPLAQGKLALRSARLTARAAAGSKAQATLRADGVQVAAGPQRVELDAIEATLEGAGAGGSAQGSPLSAAAVIAVPRLRVATGGRRVLDAPARVELRASEVIPDPDHPAASRGKVELSLTLGPVQASLRATKDRDALELELHGQANELASLRPSPRAAPPWERLPFELSSRVRVEQLASPAPKIEQQTTVRVQRPAWADLSADEATLEVRSSGDVVQHRADLDLRLRALHAAGVPTADQHVTLAARLDRRRWAGELRLVADGAVAGSLTGALAFEPRRGAVRCDLDGSFERVPALARVGMALAGLGARQGALSALSLGRLTLAVHGELLGVLSAGPGGALRVAAAPLRTAAPAGTVELRAGGLAWRTKDGAVTVPAASWRGTFRSEGERRSVDGVAQIAELRADAGDRRLEVTGFVHHLAATLIGPPAAGELESEQQLEIAEVRHELVPYRVEGVRASARARRDRDGVIQLSDLRVENAGGGTTLAAHGVLDLSGFEPRLSLEGRVEQDLARASSAPETFAGSGRVTVDLSVESPNLTLFRTVSALRFEGVHARLPSAQVAVERLDGEVPVSADVEVRGGRVVLLRQSRVNPYPALRFADQHPLLAGASFISAARLETPVFSAAPLAGNVAMEQNLVSVSQLEMGVRGGNVTGACVLDWNGRRTSLEARVRATGVLSSQGEPFDGNAAVVVSTADRSVVGRAEIVRIGRRHLLDLLDLQDPHHTDAATNRVRRVLSLGYPDHVRVTFDHGFASARITFGGLAGMVRLEDLRGIPVGPIVDKALAPFTAGEAHP